MSPRVPWTEVPDRRASVVGRRARSSGIPVPRGVGFTWECDAHLYYRRAKSNDLLLGYHGIWREKVADSYLQPA